MAARTGTSETALRRFLDEKLGNGWRHLDEEGRIIGYAGLTIERATSHQMTVDGHVVYAWCALDTLFLPRVLDRSADVRSICPVTGLTIDLRVSQDRLVSASPAEAVMSFVPVDWGRVQENVVESFCKHVHFFASEAAGQQWQGRHPKVELLSLAEGFALGQKMVAGTCCSRTPAVAGSDQPCC